MKNVFKKKFWVKWLFNYWSLTDFLINQCKPMFKKNYSLWSPFLTKYSECDLPWLLCLVGVWLKWVSWAVRYLDKPYWRAVWWMYGADLLECLTGWNVSRVRWAKVRMCGAGWTFWNATLVGVFPRPGQLKWEDVGTRKLLGDVTVLSHCQLPLSAVLCHCHL